MESTFFGASYYDEYMPCDRIDTDFKLMKDAGMNVIRIAESTWSTWEPSDNVFDFTHLHRVLDSAAKYGISVIVGTPTYAIPSWLEKKYPDIMPLTPDGQAIYGRRQIHDITNPHFLFHAERIIRKIMEEVAENPQVIGYQIDNETRSGDAYSPSNHKLFIEEMKKKYPDIKEFNREFGLDYWSNRINSWDDMPNVRGTINGSLSAAYKAFLRDRITVYQKWQADIINEYKRDDQFITHNYDYSWIGYSHGLQPLVNQRSAAEAVDLIGVDIYHRTQDNFDGSTISFGGSIGRSLKKNNYVVLETQSQGRLDWLTYPGQLRQAYYSHLANGANGVMYWNWHSIHNACESYWKGILSHDLIPGETYKELASARLEELKFDEHLKDLKKDCPIAIIADNRSLTGLDEFPIDDISDEEAKQDDWSPKKLDYNHILRWMYDACYKLNLETDIVYKEDLLQEDAKKFVSKHPILLVPALYSATEKLIDSLRRYVEAGGNLVIGFKSLVSDEEIKIYHDALPYHMTDMIGGTYDQFTRPVDTKIEINGKEYDTSHWIELIRPASEGEEIWGKYVNPYWGRYAGILHKEHASSGSTTYIGCYMESEGLTAIIKKIVAKAGISMPEYTFPIILKSGVNPLGEKVRYYFNYSGKPESFVLAESGTELISGAECSAGSKIDIEPWGVKIFV
ncbi:MAG: beta-galactosidase [Butyrivibrio sp.]|nr:beta-galactosidase [Butyrivibrio sp.]